MSSVVILTGASRGIGLAIAKQLLAKSAKVIAIARSGAALEENASSSPDNFFPIVGDVTDPAVIRKAVDFAIEKFGRVDSLILNAGVLEPVKKIADADVNEWKKCFDINFFSVVDAVSYTIPFLRKTKGRIVMTSSGASVTNYTAWGAYGSTKAAMNHLAGSIANEEPDIFTISIAPGVVATDMQVKIREQFGQDMDSDHRKFMDLLKNKKLLEPEQPGSVLANLGLTGSGEQINGKYLRWDSDLLKEYL
ncbi:NAD(P)-binding protein [Nadsonia fulvescens var. elongata DSM 6958]|uniref:NAD(P)-binding protein n=1 Tax=Nadsonia fulvescens var. elongata DSM 6958 TaxID=857566 RepID=A0A1E3PR20_9ASCO|nr:NAD(P)-binding protein [Nadsonia fulvescens var. elongata DSM 6958]